MEPYRLHGFHFVKLLATSVVNYLRLLLKHMAAKPQPPFLISQRNVIINNLSARTNLLKRKQKSKL
jgi:hypothetical protein